jgi:acylphosphatase
MQRIRARFYGIVQGVFFRANTRRKARELGLKGWIRNCNDGSVELLVEGEEERIKKLIAWCSSSIPYAEVKRVTITYEKFKNEYKDFEIKY